MPHLPWNLPEWSWWKPWEWPGYILTWLRGWEEWKEAAAKRRSAEAKASISEARVLTAQFQAKVAEMIRKIRKTENEIAAKYPNANMRPEIRPAPDDDVEIFHEAKRQIDNEKDRRREGSS